MVQFSPLFTAQPFNQLNKEVCGSHFSFVSGFFGFRFLSRATLVSLCGFVPVYFSHLPLTLSVSLSVSQSLSLSLFSLPLSFLSPTLCSFVSLLWPLFGAWSLAGPYTVSILQVQGHFQSASAGSPYIALAQEVICEFKMGYMRHTGRL